MRSQPCFNAGLRRGRGFTLIELLVALSVMALLALLSWRGLDGMVRVQATVRERMDGVVTLQTGLSQWTADLDAVFETGQVTAVDYDGRVMRLTRRDTSSDGSPLRVIGWTRRAVDGQNEARGSWVRWQSQVLHSRAELQDAWARAGVWAQTPTDVETRREVTIAGLDQWQIFYYRNNAWSNPQSAASKAGEPAGSAAPATGSTALQQNTGIAPVPDGVRIVLTLSAGQPLSGPLTKDWIRPLLGGGKS